MENEQSHRQEPLQDQIRLEDLPVFVNNMILFPIVPVEFPTTGIQGILDQIQKAKMGARSDQHPVRDIPDELRALTEERENIIPTIELPLGGHARRNAAQEPDLL